MRQATAAGSRDTGRMVQPLTPVGRVGSLARFPVKSMQGEALDAVTVTPSGLVGDRAYAVVDRADGKVASAKHPGRWHRLLHCRARFVEDPVAASPPPPVVIDLPDGSTVRSDAPEVDAVLSALCERDVGLVAAVPDDAMFDEVWPDIEGLAPDGFVESMRAGTVGGDPVTELRLASAAPGTFFDLATLHLLTTSTLDALRRAHPDGDFDVRRYRPNVVVETDGHGFVENEWAGRPVTVGDVTARVSIPTMRCVMTTLAQPGLPEDRSLLVTVASENRIQIGAMGSWACAGVYADVVEPGAVRVGDPVLVGPSR